MDDITDYEIRFIRKSTVSTSNRKVAHEKESTPDPEKQKQEYPPPKRDYYKNNKRKWWYIGLCILIVILIVFLGSSLLLLSPADNNPAESTNVSEPIYHDLILSSTSDEIESQFEQMDVMPNSSSIDQSLNKMDITTKKSVSCIEAFDTINDIPLRALFPVHAVPEFHVGQVDISDESIVLALQAADIRKDNGMIVGAAILDGEVVSKGLSKKGFVAIINGKFTIGVSESSPLFEQAIETGGDFFRQYPLVNNGVIVENKPKGRAIRRAICEMDDAHTFVVVESQEPVSFHDFSQALVDLKVRNAVYLVGSQAWGFKRDSNGQPEYWGNVKFTDSPNISFLLWRKK